MLSDWYTNFTSGSIVHQWQTLKLIIWIGTFIVFPTFSLLSTDPTVRFSSQFPAHLTRKGDLTERSNSPVGNYMCKVNNRNTRTRCEVCSKLTIKTPAQRHYCRSFVFIVNFGHLLHLVLMFPLLILNR